jgi:hypothetical protein
LICAWKMAYRLALSGVGLFAIILASLFPVSVNAAATVSFGAATNFGIGEYPNSVAISDMNGDGKLDLAVASLFSNNVSVFLGTGTGSFGAAISFNAGHAPWSVAIGDLNGDEIPDLAVANYPDGNISILLNETAVGQPHGVGGEAAEVNKLAVVFPWLVLAIAVITLDVIVGLSRRKES